MKWIVGGLIAAWCLFVIIRRIRKWKKGEFCDCGCSDCSSCPKKKQG